MKSGEDKVTGRNKVFQERGLLRQGHQGRKEDGVFSNWKKASLVCSEWMVVLKEAHERDWRGTDQAPLRDLDFLLIG